jgi:hypothetical protein
MTLDDFAKRLVRPMTLHTIERGQLDRVLFDADCLEIILEDAELAAAWLKRVREIS